MTSEAWRSIIEDPRQPLHDRSIASFYAPGSIFKVVMAVAGLETSAVHLDETVYCNGQTTLYGRRRLCWKRGGHGSVNIYEALEESVNSFFYQLALDLGIDRMHTAVRERRMISEQTEQIHQHTSTANRQ